jgi:hypothetical protein
MTDMTDMTDMMTPDDRANDASWHAEAYRPGLQYLVAALSDPGLTNVIVMRAVSLKLSRLDTHACRNETILTILREELRAACEKFAGPYAISFFVSAGAHVNLPFTHWLPIRHANSLHLIYEHYLSHLDNQELSLFWPHEREKLAIIIRHCRTLNSRVRHSGLYFNGVTHPTTDHYEVKGEREKLGIVDADPDDCLPPIIRPRA